MLRTLASDDVSRSIELKNCSSDSLVGVSSAERIDEDGESAFGSISSRNVVDRQQSPKQQARANEQQHCRGHLTHHEQRADASTVRRRRPRVSCHRLR